MGHELAAAGGELPRDAGRHVGCLRLPGHDESYGGTRRRARLMSDVTLPDTPLPGEPHGHHPFLQHHFEDLGQQHEASTLGMWMFLSTEILFFGGVLCAYWVYRIMYPEAWAVAAEQQNKLYGAINTIVLITSSLTMSLAVRNAKLGKRKRTVGMLFATLLFGSTFLAI